MDGVVSFPDSGAEVFVEIARDLSTGLMYRDSMPENFGMLFQFPQRGFHSMWMKNVRFPLDMIFIDGYRVAGILSSVPAFTETLRNIAYQSTAVLEVNAGWALRHGVRWGQLAIL
jgi:uncharacterized membrane protein (UPF0127 family)